MVRPHLKRAVHASGPPRHRGNDVHQVCLKVAFLFTCHLNFLFYLAKLLGFIAVKTQRIELTTGQGWSRSDLDGSRWDDEKST